MVEPDAEVIRYCPFKSSELPDEDNVFSIFITVGLLPDCVVKLCGSAVVMVISPAEFLEIALISATLLTRPFVLADAAPEPRLPDNANVTSEAETTEAMVHTPLNIAEELVKPFK